MEQKNKKEILNLQKILSSYFILGSLFHQLKSCQEKIQNVLRYYRVINFN